MYLKLVFQINGLSVAGGGAVSVTNPHWATFAKINGNVYLVFAFVIPMLQSIFETVYFKKGRTQDLIVTIQDNRKCALKTD